MHTCDSVCQACELTSVIGIANSRSHIWKFTTCRELTVYYLIFFQFSFANLNLTTFYTLKTVFLKIFEIMFFNMDRYFEISKRIAFGKSGYKIFISTIYKAAICKQSFNFSELQFPRSEPRIVAASNSQIYSQGYKYSLVYLNIIYELWAVLILTMKTQG